nr:DUF2335 domain-containing protein [uncultured Lachnoclostridium sp.]
MQNNVEKKSASISDKESQLLVQQYKGPIPSADELEKYEKILPGAADRILKMAEKNVDQEIYSRLQQQKIESRDSFISIFATFFTTVFLVGISAYLFLNMQSESKFIEFAKFIGAIGTLVTGISTILKIFFGKDKS